VVPQLCRALDSGSGAASVERTSTALLPRRAYCQPRHLVVAGALLPNNDRGGTQPGAFRRKSVCWSDESFSLSAAAAAAPSVPSGKTSKSRLPWPHVKLMLWRHLSRSKEKEWTPSHRKVDLRRGSTGDARCIYSTVNTHAIYPSPRRRSALSYMHAGACVLAHTCSRAS
jgi:hypothetical protein